MSRVAEAAAQMRARAEAATQADWWYPTLASNKDGSDGEWIVDSPPQFICSTHDDRADTRSNAEHIASLHPAVALVIADALRDIDAAIAWGDWMSVEAAIRKVADVYLDGAS